MRNFLLVLFALLIAAPASASGFYITAFGGANWDDVINAKGVEDNTGTVIGAAVGSAVASVPGLSVEIELANRNNEVEVFNFVTVDHEQFSLMANAVYEVPVNLGRVKPYIMGGIGYGHSEARLEDISLLSVESSGVSYQLGAGLNFQVAPDVKAGIGYRYYSGPELEVLGTELSDGSNHSVLAHLTLFFN